MKKDKQQMKMNWNKKKRQNLKIHCRQVRDKGHQQQKESALKEGIGMTTDKDR